MAALSPTTLSVTAALSSVSYASVPADVALNRPIFPSVIGRASFAFAVNVFVRVVTPVPLLYAHVAWARRSPPPAASPAGVPTTTSDGSVVFAAEAAATLVDVAIYWKTAGWAPAPLPPRCWAGRAVRPAFVRSRYPRPRPRTSPVTPSGSHSAAPPPIGGHSTPRRGSDVGFS